MHHATVYIDPTGPTPIGFAQAAGVPGDVRFDFKTQSNIAYPNIADMYPQMILRPFTRPEYHLYDIEINDPTGSSGIATVPAYVMNDRFSVEVYSRDSDEHPLRMLAYGKIDLNGYAYLRTGMLGPATYPTGPAGPTGKTGATGPVGAQGIRGSRWYTGTGDPALAAIPDVRVDGDMYLDEATADVWRWDGTTAAWLGYRRA